MLRTTFSDLTYSMWLASVLLRRCRGQEQGWSLTPGRYVDIALRNSTKRVRSDIHGLHREFIKLSGAPMNCQSSIKIGQAIAEDG